MNASFPCNFLDEEPAGVDLLPSKAAENSPPSLLSKAGFLCAVETLSGRSTQSGLTDFERGMESVFMSRPYFDWIRLFGEPRNIEQRSLEAGQSAVQVWEQACSDGSIHCVGHFVDDRDVGQMIILTRVCDF